VYVNDWYSITRYRLTSIQEQAVGAVAKFVPGLTFSEILEAFSRAPDVAQSNDTDPIKHLRAGIGRAIGWWPRCHY
jgi:hypothetical protein